MPSVSMVLAEAETELDAPGEGGGVCSASREGGSALMRTSGGLIEHVVVAVAIAAAAVATG